MCFHEFVRVWLIFFFINNYVCILYLKIWVVSIVTVCTLEWDPCSSKPYRSCDQTSAKHVEGVLIADQQTEDKLNMEISLWRSKCVCRDFGTQSWFCSFINGKTYSVVSMSLRMVYKSTQITQIVLSYWIMVFQTHVAHPPLSIYQYLKNIGKKWMLLHPLWNNATFLKK